MPLYDFECRGCANQFEALVRPGSTTACPTCGSEDLEQLLSSFSVSSDTLRKTRLKAVRQRAAKAREEKVHADHAYMHKHLEEDH